jgi:hypothetical protein
MKSLRHNVAHKQATDVDSFMHLLQGGDKNLMSYYTISHLLAYSNENKLLFILNWIML